MLLEGSHGMVYLSGCFTIPRAGFLSYTHATGSASKGSACEWVTKGWGLRVGLSGGVHWPSLDDIPGGVKWGHQFYLGLDVEGSSSIPSKHKDDPPCTPRSYSPWLSSSSSMPSPPWRLDWSPSHMQALHPLNFTDASHSICSCSWSRWPKFLSQLHY